MSQDRDKTPTQGNFDSTQPADGDKTPTKADFHPIQHLAKDDVDNEPEDLSTAPTFDFSPKDMTFIHSCLRSVTLPMCVDRPPVNLGEASHGKLKAHEYLVLFAFIFPLVLPHLWWGKGPSEQALLSSFAHLVAATNIISSYSTSNAEADKYTAHYVAYRASIQAIFPFASSVPNHHFAMHYGLFLKYWGPVATLSEFPGERMNGLFQKVKHSGRTSRFSYSS